MKWCSRCGRQKHDGLCNMAELSNGRIVHVDRLGVNGDLHESIMDGTLKVVNRWIKKLGDKTKGDRSNEVEQNESA